MLLRFTAVCQHGEIDTPFLAALKHNWSNFILIGCSIIVLALLSTFIATRGLVAAFSSIISFAIFLPFMICTIVSFRAWMCFQSVYAMTRFIHDQRGKICTVPLVSTSDRSQQVTLRCIVFGCSKLILDSPRAHAFVVDSIGLEHFRNSFIQLSIEPDVEQEKLPRVSMFFPTRSASGVGKHYTDFIPLTTAELLTHESEEVRQLGLSLAKERKG